jgi:quercetin dioxygenase-like cupin family protein
MISTFVFAQTQSDEIDPVTVSANLYKVLFENEHVRVVEYEVPPGQKDNWHTHPAKVSYIVSGGTLKITTEAGESFIVEEEIGAASWFEAVGRHYGENIGKTPVRIVFVEIKNVDSAREDINKYRRDENKK